MKLGPKEKTEELTNKRVLMNYIKKAPITLEIIIHYYCQGETDFIDSIAFKEQSKMLIEAGLLIATKNSKRKFEPNRDAVEVYLNALLVVPFPELKWTIPSLLAYKD